MLESLSLSGSTTSTDVNIQRLLSSSRLRSLTADCSTSAFHDVLQHLTALSSLTCLTLTNVEVPYGAVLELTNLRQLHCLTISSKQHPAAYVRHQTCGVPASADSPPGSFQLVALHLAGCSWHAADLSVRSHKPCASVPLFLQAVNSTL